MVNLCCVRNVCERNPALHVHKFPRNLERKQSWISKVPLKDFVPNTSSVICSAHFEEGAYKVEREDSNMRRAENKQNQLLVKVLKNDAIPTIWPNCPAYLTKTSTPKRQSRNSSGSRSNEDSSLLNDTSVLGNLCFLEERGETLPSLDSLHDSLDTTKFPKSVNYMRKEKQIALFCIVLDERGKPEIRFSVVIKESLEFTIWVNEMELEIDQIPSDCFISNRNKITSCDQLYTIINYLDQNYSSIHPKEESIIESALKKLELLRSNQKVEFIKEQLSLLYSKPNGRRYSKELLAMSIIWQNVSPACYRQILGYEVLSLPSVRHVRRLSSSLNVDLELTDSAVAYLTARKSKLSPKDLLINIVMDEVHCLQSVQFCNGKFYGMENNQSTKTLLVVMIRSVAGSYRDVVCMSPTHNINQEKIFKVWTDVIRHVTAIGFDVVATMTDGHSANMKFFSSLIRDLNLQNDERVIKNPFDLQRLVCLLFAYLCAYL